jgi:ketosteroid isomerase-like protein
MRKFAILLSIVILVAFVACNSAPQAPAAFDPSSVKAEIIAANQQFDEAFVKGDSAGIAALYHADAKIFPPNMHSCNRDEMGGMMKMIPQMHLKTMKLNTDEVSGGPDEIVETGNYEMDDSTKTVDKGNYVVVWKKDGDKWKIFRDIWNSSAMPAAMK